MKVFIYLLSVKLTNNKMVDNPWWLSENLSHDNLKLNKDIIYENDTTVIYTGKLGNKNIIYKTYESDIYDNEIIISRQINMLRYFIPNFPFYYGTASFNDKNGMVFEKIDYIESPSKTIWKKVFPQILCAIQLAQATLCFTHNDMHMDNVLITKYDRYKTLNYPIYYHGQIKVLKIKTRYLASIIDYGMSSIYYGKKLQREDTEYNTKSNNMRTHNINASNTARDMYILSSHLKLYKDFWKNDIVTSRKIMQNYYFMLGYASKASIYNPSDMLEYLIDNNLMKCKYILVDDINIKYKIPKFNNNFEAKKFNYSALSKITNLYCNMPNSLSYFVIKKWLNSFKLKVPDFQNRVFSIENTMRVYFNNLLKVNVDFEPFLNKYEQLNKSIKNITVTDATKLMLQYTKDYTSFYYYYNVLLSANITVRHSKIHQFYKLQILVGRILKYSKLLGDQTIESEFYKRFN